MDRPNTKILRSEKTQLAFASVLYVTTLNGFYFKNIFK